MATVRNIRLKIGRVAGGREFADVSYDIVFSEAERRLNLLCREVVSLYERDDALDRYIVRADTDPANRPALVANQDTDDFIGTVRDGSVRPNHAGVLHRRFRREWDFPNNEWGNEEYRSLVTVAPEIRTGAGWSNEVSINVA